MTSDYKHNNNSNDHNDTPLSNDPIIVNDEIERLHRKIFHLRRTNNDIRKCYADDPDCVQALKENVVVIDNTLQVLFVQFELYQQLCTKQHFYTKLYESDLKMRDKLHAFTSFQSEPPVRQLQEFDLDDVAQRLKQKSKELQAVAAKTQIQKVDNDADKNNDTHDDATVDDDGGFTL